MMGSKQQQFALSIHVLLEELVLINCILSQW
jgi:hypothetical protein